MEKAGGVKIDDEYMYGSDYQGSGSEAPPKTPPPAPSKPPPGHPEYNISQGGGNDNNNNNNRGNAGGTQLGSGMTTGQHAAFRR